jgi:hypothetical protein
VRLVVLVVLEKLVDLRQSKKKESIRQLFDFNLKSS